jgi:hypothetical protein
MFASLGNLGIYPGAPEEGMVKVDPVDPAIKTLIGNSGTTYLYHAVDQKWIPCPTWPTPPSLSSDPATAIAQIRDFYDKANSVWKWVENSLTMKYYPQVQGCPGYPSWMFGYGTTGPRINEKLVELLGKGVSYGPFGGWLWQKALAEKAVGNYGVNWQTSGTASRSAPASVAQWAKNLATVHEAWMSIPWPHEFFRTFLLDPKVPTPVFANGLQLRDPELAATCYFPATVDKIHTDIAKYIAANEEAFNKHFETEILQWAHDLEKRARELATWTETFSKVMMVVGAVLDLFSAGVGSLVCGALSAAVTIHNVKELTSIQKESFFGLQEILGITTSNMEAFRLWIVSRLGPKAPEVPQTPPAAQIGAYSIFIENVYWKSFDNATIAIQEAYKATQVGNRIILKNEASGLGEGMFLRESTGLRSVPPSVAGQLQALPADSAKTVAGGAGFPTWTAMIPVAMMVLK